MDGAIVFNASAPHQERLYINGGFNLSVGFKLSKIQLLEGAAGVLNTATAGELSFVSFGVDIALVWGRCTAVPFSTFLPDRASDF